MQKKRPTKVQAEYWEKKLQSYGLGMARGKGSKLSYGWRYSDTDGRNSGSDDYSEESEP